MVELVSKALKLFHVLITPMWRNALLRHRVAAGVEHRGVLRQLKGVRTIVDIGANRGQFSLVARQYFPRCRIVSFEPLPEPAALYRMVFGGDQDAILFECAIGPRNASAPIHVSKQDDSSSLLPIGRQQSEVFPGTEEVRTQRVQVARLADRVLKSDVAGPALLKIDVQGYELEVLAGSEDLIHCFSWIYVECSFMELYVGQALADDVIAWLHGRGFALCGVYNVTYRKDGTAVQADLLFHGRRS